MHIYSQKPISMRHMVVVLMLSHDVDPLWWVTCILYNRLDMDFIINLRPHTKGLICYLSFKNFFSRMV